MTNIRNWVAAMFLVLAGQSALAQTCSSLPYSLANGNVADAGQVMTNFNYLLSCVNGVVLRGYVGGLTLSNDTSSPNTAVDTSAGMASSDDALTLITIGAFTKSANTSWALGTGSGCLDSGSTLAANTWYHLFVIMRTDTRVVDELCSESATAPHLPTPYSEKRRIGSFRTDASSYIMSFSQDGDRFDWLIPYQEFAGAGSTSPVIIGLKYVPTGVTVEAILSGAAEDTSPSTMYLSSIAQTAMPVTGLTVTSGVPIAGSPAFAAFGGFRIETNTSAQIRYETNDTTSTWYINANGWVDTRGRFN